MSSLKEIVSGLPLDPLPPKRMRDESIVHAPKRKLNLSVDEQKLAIQNALRYFPTTHHATLATEFRDELFEYGHIYMYRFMPQLDLRAYPIEKIPSRTQAGAAIIHMIMNNLDRKVAQFPQELVTYGGNGQVFSNWAQFWLVMHYLSTMDESQTLVMYSGHPLGLFPSSPQNPRLVITNGMVVPNYSTRANYDKMFGLGVTMYGQMTAGSYCYIGPQGIVHGTTLTVLNAGRKYLGLDSLAGKAYLTSGLGGMSGAQAKSAVICGCVGIIAEVSLEALQKRHRQGWLCEIVDNLDDLVKRVRKAKAQKEATSIGYHGNIVAVWERFVHELETTGELLAELGSDQTSCHNPFNGGYYPVQLTFEDGQKLLASDPAQFQLLVEESLRRHVKAINTLSDAGLFFWDYGNAFLLEARRAGADVGAKVEANAENTKAQKLGNGTRKVDELGINPGSQSEKGKEDCDGGSGIAFRYPSYVQDIMGDIFSLGFGPFRWVCTSGDPSDLAKTDKIAMDVLKGIIEEGLPNEIVQQYKDNLRWMSEVDRHQLVVGSQARILYSDQQGRVAIACAFNQAVARGDLKGPVVISRDHHDVSGTDSPFRETSNVTDGSAFTADMAVQNCIGDAFRGATWVAIHNGGGCGWGEVINGGFGMVLDGSQEAESKANSMLNWDVANGVARRSWSGNENAQKTIKKTMQRVPNLIVTTPHPILDPKLLDRLF